MLPYFSASGHYHYQKSVYLYLQTMSQIHMTHPGLHKHFMNGLHVIRRSDRFWTGLSPDLVIEQVLMAEVNRAMQDFTGTKYQTRDQHKNTAQARITRDHLDGLKILQYLLERDPFTSEENLINPATVEVADESINVHQAFEIGEMLIHGMSNQLVFSFSFKDKDMVVPMKTKSSLSIEGEKIHVDSAFFLMNETDKPKLKHALSKLLPETVHVIPPNSKCVLDGELLLHKVP